jgi:hypothetical protein
MHDHHSPFGLSQSKAAPSFHLSLQRGVAAFEKLRPNGV